MSRIKATKRSREQRLSKPDDWPVVVYMWAFGLAILSYMTARVILDGQPHPYHWLAGLLGGIVGIPLGWLWYRWRGDVF